MYDLYENPLRGKTGCVYSSVILITRLERVYHLLTTAHHPKRRSPRERAADPTSYLHTSTASLFTPSLPPHPHPTHPHCTPHPHPTHPRCPLTGTRHTLAAPSPAPDTPSLHPSPAPDTPSLPPHRHPTHPRCPLTRTRHTLTAPSPAPHTLTLHPTPSPLQHLHLTRPSYPHVLHKPPPSLPPLPTRSHRSIDRGSTPRLPHGTGNASEDVITSRFQ